jgi:hypothetical protein
MVTQQGNAIIEVYLVPRNYFKAEEIVGVLEVETLARESAKL